MPTSTRIINTSLDVDPIGSNTSLARMAPFQRHQLLNRLVEVGIVENKERTVPTEFESQFLKTIGSTSRLVFMIASLLF
jgi:hypothetical protein